MDQISLDLTDVPGASEGDEVVLMGRQGDQEITTEELGAWAGTNSYEIVTGLSARVPRCYLREGEPVDFSNLLGRRGSPKEIDG